MTWKYISPAFAAFVLLLAAGGAHAQIFKTSEFEPVRGFYLGGGIGYGNVRAYDDDDDWFGDISYGDPDFAFALTGGYRLMRFFAVEVSYVDSGTPEFDDNLVELREFDDIFDADTRIDIDATQVTALGILPLANDRVEFFVKLGASFWDATSRQELVSRTGGTDIRRKINEDGTDFIVGIGAALNLNKHWHLRVEATSQQIDDDLLALGKDEDASLETVTAQIHYRFGDQW